MHGEGGSWKTKARMGPAAGSHGGGALFMVHYPAGGAACNKGTTDLGRYLGNFLTDGKKAPYSNKIHFIR